MFICREKNLKNERVMKKKPSKSYAVPGDTKCHYVLETEWPRIFIFFNTTLEKKK